MDFSVKLRRRGHRGLAVKVKKILTVLYMQLHHPLHLHTFSIHRPDFFNCLSLSFSEFPYLDYIWIIAGLQLDFNLITP